MCGILVTRRIDRSFHHRLLSSLRKRGPDGIGFWSDGTVQIAHSRLAIIGLDERSSEPLENETHVLAFNGEIYNFHDLKRRLEKDGARVRGSNDAEVLLESWSRWGESILPELTGFWAFAVYDKMRRTLTLVRDQFGVKPLYYWLDGERLCVASMLRTILDVVSEPRDLDYAAISEYARYQFTFGDKTFVKQIRKVLPGQIVEIDLEAMSAESRCYEDIFASRLVARTHVDEAWMDETRALVAQCVLDSTISDTSFTTFCSGGIDSSLITALARPEIAYHCNYSDPECNETFFAQQVVQGSPVRLFTVNALESFDLVERLRDIVNDFDELSIGSVILPLDDILSQVKRRYKVILTGTGGDELFAGYVRYQLVLGECYQDSYRALFERMRPLRSVVDRFELTHAKGDSSLYRFYDPLTKETFFSAFEQCGPQADPLRAMLQFDQRYFLQGLLNIDDRMCGRHGLESRPSFLHQRLVRHIQGVDSRSMLNNGELKPLLRQLSATSLPKSVLHRTDKMGFTTPVGTFVNSSAGLIREQIMNSPFRDLYDLRKMNFTAETKFSREAFGLLMLDLWLNRYAHV